MINEMENFVNVEGILSEINLDETSYKKEGVDVPCIRGDIKIKSIVPLVQNGEEVELEIPIRFFSNKFTNAGNENPSYTNLKEIINSGKSIAAVGENEADCVRIGGGRIVMQEYYTPDQRLISFPSIQASFINKVKRSDFKYRADADFQAIVGKIGMQTDNEGIETDTMQITAITVGYNEYTDIIPVITNNEKYISAINNTFKVGDMVKIGVRLNFSSKVETYYEEAEIGEPIERQRTINVSDLILKAITSSDIEELSEDEINHLINNRTKRLEKAKSKAAEKGNTRSKANEQAKFTLGF